ncbi:MAG: hypothetical protein JSV53_09490 [candidate division WOR-3 bacterium]|nr:MAG: hypothetical protein JSV53_09490 [candidate division WOR-3 bacterium]
MFVRRTCILIVVVFFGGVVYASETTNKLQELDSIGMMPEVIVTAPRYEIQDEAWLGMIEGVVVEAQRPSIMTEENVAGANSGKIAPNSDGFDSIRGESIIRLLLPLTLTLATISILYMSIHAYLNAEEVKHE